MQDHVSGAEPASENTDWRRFVALVGLSALAMFVFCLIYQDMFADGDTNWHVATGRWILEHGRVPTTDPFSFSAYGHRWVAHEWLSEVLMALAWRAAGWSGVMLLIAAVAALAVGLLAAELAKRMGTLSVIAGVALIFMLHFNHLLARPHMIALPVLVVWIAALLKARRERRSPPLWLLPVAAVWANLHGSVIFGLAFTAPFALEAFLEARGEAMARLPAPEAGEDEKPKEGKPDWRRALRRSIYRQRRAIFEGGAWIVALKWGAFLIAACACALLTPNGLDGLLYGFYVTSMPHLRWINEWKSFNFDNPSSFEFALFFTLFICLYRGLRMGAVRLGLLLLTFYMTLQHLRQELVIAVMAPLLLADPMRRTLEPTWPAKPSPIAWPAWRELAAPLAVMTALFAALAAWRVATPEIRGNSGVVPYTALSRVPAALRAKPVFNDYSFGGWLVYKGVRPFMDGRSDMYGDDLLKLYVDAAGADPAAVEKAFKRYDIQWTILTPTSALAKALDKRPGWRRFYADKWAVVHVRQDALAAAGTGANDQKVVKPTPPPPSPRLQRTGQGPPP
jgi:hypothetical protein